MEGQRGGQDEEDVIWAGGGADRCRRYAQACRHSRSHARCRPLPAGGGTLIAHASVARCNKLGGDDSGRRPAARALRWRWESPPLCRAGVNHRLTLRTKAALAFNPSPGDGRRMVKRKEEN